MKLSFPHQYEFGRPAGPAQFLRALLIIALGAGMIWLSQNLSRFISLPESSAVPRIVLYVGIFIAVSGGLAVLLLLLALAVYRNPSVIEVDETGLTYQRSGKPKQSVKWADVESYDPEVGGLINLSLLMTPSNTGLSHSGSDASNDLFGCVFGLVFGLYLLILESLIGTGSWTVRFKMKSRRGMTIFGYGPQMDEIVQKVIPHFLPDKRKTETAQTEQEDGDLPQQF